MDAQYPRKGVLFCDQAFRQEFFKVFANETQEASGFGLYAIKLEISWKILFTDVQNAESPLKCALCSLFFKRPIQGNREVGKGSGVLPLPQLGEGREIREQCGPFGERLS